jgi:hypothetical protein
MARSRGLGDVYKRQGQDFGDGIQVSSTKGFGGRARAVRRFTA